MLAKSLIEEIDRLLKAGDMSQRKIAATRGIQSPAPNSPTTGEMPIGTPGIMVASGGTRSK